MSTTPVTLAQLTIADPPDVWESLGFAVAGSRTSVSGVEHNLVGASGEGHGILGWTLAGLVTPPPQGRIDGLVTSVAERPGSPAPATHPNGVVSIDHVVVATADLGRTVGCFEQLGLSVRRTRDSGTYGTPMRQAFFKLGTIVLEVIGAAEPMPEYADRPAGFFGVAFTVADLDATAAYLGERLHPAKDAVQPGRRIATLDRGAGSTVAIAFMSAGPVDY